MRVLLFIIAFYPLLTIAQQSYVCTPTATTGFNYKTTGRWESAIFNPSHSWLLRPANEDERLRAKEHPYVVVEVGSKDIRSVCQNEPSLGQVLTCPGLFMDFSFQLGKSNKYAIKSFGSYFFSDELVEMLGGGTRDSMYLEHGKCSKI